jgi:hypothetical protein
MGALVRESDRPQAGSGDPVLPTPACAIDPGRPEAEKMAGLRIALPESIQIQRDIHDIRAIRG